MTNSPTVFVIDDDEAIRDAIRFLLESVALEVAVFSSAETFLDGHSMHQTGCILLDIRMPEMSGLQLQQLINKRKFSMPIIMITGYGDVSMTVTAMKNGALDFVEKPFHNQDILDKIHTALQLDKSLVQKRLEYDAVIARIAMLTRREGEILQLVATKNTNKQIAEKLYLSIKTVESHRSHLMEKMRADSLIHLLDILRQNQIDLD